MYCSNCGKEIDSDSKFCQFCGAKVGTFQNNENDNLYNQNQIKENIAYGTKVLPKKYCYFNWGAWQLSWIYAFFNRVPSWGFFLLFVNIIQIGIYAAGGYCGAFWMYLILFQLPVSICFGFNANKWAYENYPYDDIKEFMRGQDKWNGWGIFFLILNILIWLCVFWVAASISK